ncbi:MAG: arylesterase [Bacteroidota bacterium]
MRHFFWIGILILGISCQNSSTEQNSNTPVKTETNTITTSKDTRKTVMFFGNSLTAGYGLDEDQSFPSLIQQKIDSLGLEWKVVNAGYSGETSAGGLQRVDWMLKQQVDVFVLELGGNDALRGLPVPELQKNLQAIIDKVFAAYPESKVVVAAMEAPPNMGPEYTNGFRQVFKTLAEPENVTYLPFLLDKVGGIPALNLPDGIHPNVEGAKIVAENVWSTLNALLHDER